MEKIIPVMLAFGGAFAAIGGEVSFKEDTTVLATDETGQEEKSEK